MPKVQIDIILRGCYCPFQTSMAVRVIDLESTKFLFFDALPTSIIDEPLTIPEQQSMDDEMKGSPSILKKKMTDTCCDSVITLYSDKNFEKFAQQLKLKFNFTECSPCNNCSDTADFTLDYFFPEKKKQIDIYYALYKVLCCWGSALFCTRFFPGPCFINTPGDVHKKARIIFWLNNSENSHSEGKSSTNYLHI